MLLLIFLFTALLSTSICIYLLIGFPKWSCNAALIIIHWFIMLASFLCVLYILGRGIIL